MLVTPEQDHRNHRAATTIGGTIAVFSLVGSFVSLTALAGLPLAGLAFWIVRRRCRRRRAVMAVPFPEQWERALTSNVEFFRGLNDEGKKRFRNLIMVFLDEVTITGVGTDVDETTRALVAASAVIPIFGFADWEYSGLGEVLIYPGAFDATFRTDESVRANTLGMVGVHHLSGVMILSKPDLISGFTNPKDKRNVGIHEFAHLVDKADGSVDGVPLGVDVQTVQPWIDWVGKELATEGDGHHHIDDYAFTNEAEYFAVLSEYFFEAPATLQRKDPQLYQMMRSMYHQDTIGFLGGPKKRQRRRVGRNDDCPCGSKAKFKKCCGSRRTRGTPRPGR